MGSKVALFFPNYSESLITSLLPLALAARQHYGVEPVVILRTPDQVAIKQLNDHGITYNVLPESLLPDTQNDRVFRLRDAGSTLKWLSSQWAHITHGMREAETIFQRFQPIAIFEVMESSVIEMFVNHVAQRRNVPTVLLQWAWTSPKEDLDFYHGDQYQHKLARIPGALHPLYLARRTVGRKLLSLLYLVRGIRYGKFLGDGNAGLFAVMNPSSVELFRSQGVSPRKLVSTGHPEDDVLYQYHHQYADPSEQARARDEFGLDRRKPVIVYAREAIAHDKLLDRETDHSLIRTVLSVATRQQGAQVVLKLHPRDDTEYYRWVANEFPQVVQIHRCDFYRLLAVSDVYLSQGSSTTRWAVRLGKPVLLIGWARLKITGAVATRLGLKPVDSGDELDEQLRHVLGGGSTPLTPQIEVQRSQFDGRATERILKLAGLTVTT